MSNEIEIAKIPSLKDNPLPEKPQDVLDLENALKDLHFYKVAVGAATFPGAQLKSGSKLLEFLEKTFKQLEDQYKEHPYIQDLISKSKAATNGKG